MLKQSPCRSYRSQGIKVKHVLQFCFLLACCLWLIHQVKPCHENEARISPKTDRHNEVLKLGRKDLSPQSEETRIGDAKHEHDEEEAVVGEEEEEEEESKPGEEEDRGGGDDEIDELDQEREFEGEEDFVDVKEDGEVEDQEAEEKYSERNKESQDDNRISLEEAIAGEKGEISGNLEAISLGHENNSKVAFNSNQFDSILMISSNNTEKEGEARGESSNSSAAVPEKVTASNATSHGSSEPIKDVDNLPENRTQGNNNRGVAVE